MEINRQGININYYFFNLFLNNRRGSIEISRETLLFHQNRQTAGQKNIHHVSTYI